MLTGQLEKLARDHYVHIDYYNGLDESTGEKRRISIPGPVPIVGEIVAEMKRRLQVIEPYENTTRRQKKVE